MRKRDTRELWTRVEECPVVRTKQDLEATLASDERRLAVRLHAVRQVLEVLRK